MQLYKAYDLNILSDILISDLPPGHGDPDVIIRNHKIDMDGELSISEQRTFKKIGDNFFLAWPKYAKFSLRDGKEILADSNPDCDPNLFTHLLLGPILSVLLLQRGISVFHASALALGEVCVGFLAAKGHGKSTQAAALIKRGAKLVSDDVLAISYQEKRPWALPGIPHMKLWPEVMEIIGEAPDDHPRVTEDMLKRSVTAPGLCYSGRIPIRALYVLQFGYSLEILPLNKKEALRLILPHWYGALFKGDLLPLLGLHRHFNECVSIIESVPIYLLKRPVSLDLLEDVCQAVECHISENKS